MLPEVLQHFPGVRIYKDWRQLLADESDNLDSVNISVPDHMHAIMTIAAMKLGLHVYCQKPLAHNISEVRRMEAVARSSGVVTQMGTQLASMIYERQAVQMIQDGWIGPVREVHVFSHKTWGDASIRPAHADPIPAELDWDLWCGVAPRADFVEGYYHPGHWRKRLDYGTGTLGDMGCHIYSGMFRALGLTQPLGVRSLGRQPNATNWAVDEWIEYRFAGNALTSGKELKVTWTDGSLGVPPAIRILTEGILPDQGTVFLGEEGVLLAPHWERAQLFPRERFKDRRPPRLEPRDHYLDFLNASRGESVNPIADFLDYGVPLTETILLGGIATHFPAQWLEWDSKNMQFLNHPEANTHLSRPYREGWSLEGGLI